MARDIHDNVITATQQQTIRGCHLGKFEFKDETLYFNTSPVEITYNSQVYYAVGNLGSVDDIVETDELSSSSLDVHLSMFNDKVRDYAASLEYANRPATIYRAYLDENYNLIGEPLVLFYGSMDNVAFNERGDQSVLSLTIADHLVDWARTRNGRYTSAEQKLIDSTDTGLDHITNAVEKSRGEIEVEWRVS